MLDAPFIAGTTEKDVEAMGITAWGIVPTEIIVFSPEVRQLCEGNMCRGYGKTWACPPAVGTYEECCQAILSYSHGLVFSSVYQLEDSFDFEGMSAGHRAFKDVCDRLYERLEKPFLLLSNEGCNRCQSCTYPQAPCRFPDKLFPSLEGYGMLVNRLAQSAGIPYTNGQNTVTYFGMVCFTPPTCVE